MLFRGKTLSGDNSDCTLILQEFDSEKKSFKLGKTKVFFLSLRSSVFYVLFVCGSC